MTEQPPGVFSGIPLNVDPDTPPGVIELRSGESRARALLGDTEGRAMARSMAERAERDPEFAEDIASILESKDWITHPGEMTAPEKCEVCGTLVTFVPEAHVARRGKPEPALWETGLWRKHTPRRCGAMRRLSP